MSNTPKLTQRQRFTAAALVMAGCSVRGTAQHFGINGGSVDRYLTSRKVLMEIHECGGKQAFIHRYLDKHAREAINAHSRSYMHGSKKPEVMLRRIAQSAKDAT